MKNKFKFCKNKLSLFLSVLFLLILCSTNNTTFAATTPSISYTISGETKVGSTIEIAVNVSNVTDLYGGSIDFVYDTSLLEVQSISKGDIFGTTTVLTPLGSNGQINKGQASFAISISGNKPGVTKTKGTLAIIKAKILKEGTVKLNTTSSNTPDLSLSGNTVRVKLANSIGSNISYSSTNKSISILNNASINLTSNYTTRPLGQSITFTASSNLGSNAEYAFFVYIDGAWKLVQNYSSKNTLAYTAPKAGTYKVRAWVREKNNTSNRVYKELSFSVTNDTTIDLTSNYTTRPLGQSITFTASSNLGSNAEYAFFVYIDDAWKLVQNYSSKNTLAYTAPKAGTYKVRAWVREKNNTSNRVYKELSFSVTNDTTIDLTSNYTTRPLGQSITFTASSNLGSNAEYAFFVYIDDAWKLVQNYSSKNTLAYTAPKAGTYKVRAWVREKNNTSNRVYKELSFSVTNDTTIDLTSNYTTRPLGQSITFTASSNLGSNAEYAFFVYIDEAWKLVQNYSSKNTLAYTAPKAGTYKVRAWVREKNNTSNRVYKELSFSVTNDATIGLTSNYTTRPLGQSITFTASSNLGSNAEYAFFVYIDDAWKLVQNYSSKNTLAYTAPKAGTYKVRAWVREKNNTSNRVYKELSFSVTK